MLIGKIWEAIIMSDEKMDAGATPEKAEKPLAVDVDALVAFLPDLLHDGPADGVDVIVVVSGLRSLADNHPADGLVVPFEIVLHGRDIFFEGDLPVFEHELLGLDEPS